MEIAPVSPGAAVKSSRLRLAEGRNRPAKDLSPNPADAMIPDLSPALSRGPLAGMVLPAAVRVKETDCNISTQSERDRFGGPFLLH